MHSSAIPPLTAIKGTTYSYTPNVFTDEQAYEVILLNGPKGVTVENNIVKWDVPADAESDFVELRAETDNGDIIDQTYFVHVHGENSLIKRDTSIVKFEALTRGRVHRVDRGRRKIPGATHRLL